MGLSAEQKLKKAELKSAAQIETIKATKEMTISVLDNPMFGLVLGVIALEYAERKGWTGPIITTSTEAGLIAVSTARALAPILPQLAGITGAAAKLIPGV